MSAGNNEIGELLIDLGLITNEQLSDAITEQQSSGDRLTLVLARLGLITERQLKDALELQYGVNFINLSSSPPEEEFVRMVAEEIERKYRFVPVSKQGAQYTVAMVDPDDLIAADAVRQNLQSGNFKKLVCTADDFNHLMYLVYEGGAALLEEQARLAEAGLSEEADVEPAGLSEEKIEVEPAPAAELIERLEEDAVAKSKSKSKKKSAMRNLFNSDDDDDLDTMFGDDDEKSAVPTAESTSDEAAEQSEPDGETRGSAARKSFTSLFADEDDDDFESSEPSAVADKNEEEMPTSDLLEHILEEAESGSDAEVTPKKKKKSFSLFDDEGEDMELETTEEEVSTPVPVEEPEVELEPEVEVLEREPEDLPAADLEIGSDSLADEESEPEPIVKSSGRASKSKKLRSLFDDEMEEDDLFGHSEESVAPSTELVPEDEDASGSRPETKLYADQTDEGGESDTIDSTESLMKAIEKPFQSLFDDDSDEDDLFDKKDILTVPEEEPAVEPVDEADEDADEAPSAGDKKSKKGRAIQSLFEDEMDEDSLFAVDEMVQAEPAEAQSELAGERESEFQSVESLIEPELEPTTAPFPESLSEPDLESVLDSLSESQVNYERDESQIETGVNAELEPGLSLDLESSLLLEDELEPVFELKRKGKKKGPDLEDLLSRFESAEPQEEEDAAPAPAAELAEEEPEQEEPDEDEQISAERPPIDALIAALDDQLPDDTFVAPATAREGKEEPVADSDDSEPEESGDFAAMDKMGYGKEEQFAESGDWASVKKPEPAEEIDDQEGLYEVGMFSPLNSLIEESDESNEFAIEVSRKQEEELESAPEPTGKKPSIRDLLDATEQIDLEEQEGEADIPDISELSEVLAELSERYKDDDEPGSGTEPAASETSAAALAESPLPEEPLSEPAEPEYQTLEEALEDTGFQSVISGADSLLHDGSADLLKEEPAADERPPLEEIDEILPLDREDLQEKSLATSELPPYVVSRSAKHLSSGGQAGTVSEPVGGEAAAAADLGEPGAQSAPEAVAPVNYGELQTGLPGGDFTHTGIQRQLAEIVDAMPQEVPDGLDDVLANVTNDIIDSVDLSQLPGSKAEISFLEEIVESELSMPEDAGAKDSSSEEPAAPLAYEAPPARAPLVEAVPTAAVAHQSAPAAHQAAAASTAPAPAPAPAPARTSQPTPYVPDPSQSYVHPQLTLEIEQKVEAQPASATPAVANEATGAASSGPVPYVPQPSIAQTPPAQAPAPTEPVQQEPAPQPVHQEPAPQPVQPAPAPAPVAQESAPQAVANKEPAPAPDLDESIMALTAQILSQAVNSGCSEIHFEPVDAGIALRFMVEGELLDETVLPREIQGMLILCLKSMAGLDISIIDRPQDTRFTTDSFGPPVEMRVTSIPGVHGEMVAVALRS